MVKLAKISLSKANKVNKSFNIPINRLLHHPHSKNRTIKNDPISSLKVWWKQPRKSATAASGTTERVPSITMLLIIIICHFSILLTVIRHFIPIFTASCLHQWACIPLTILLITICTVRQTHMLRLLNSLQHLQSTPKTSHVTAWSVCKVFSCICSSSSAKVTIGMKLTAILEHQQGMSLSEVPTTNVQERHITELHAVKNNKCVTEPTLVPTANMRINNRSSHLRSKELINSNKVVLRTATRDFKALLRAELELIIPSTVLPEALLPIWSQHRNHCIRSSKTAPASLLIIKIPSMTSEVITSKEGALLTATK